MQIRAEQLAAALAKGLRPLYVIHGDEPLLAQEAADAVRAAARAAGLDFQQLVLAILAAGGAFVPVDPQWPADRRHQVLTDTRAVAVPVAPGGACGP